MENKLLEYFSKISPLSPEESAALLESISNDTKTMGKGTYLLKEGQISKNSYFVIEGCVREYVFEHGEEKTTNFFTENQWVISLNGLAENAPSNHYWVCLEDTTLVIGNEEKAQALFKKFPRFETISRATMEAAYAEQNQRLSAHITNSPEQRYLHLLKSRPELIQRVPLYQLASYLGIKPESLSRIRKRIKL